jgi:Ca2+-binding EF-hand superfamily protein
MIKLKKTALSKAQADQIHEIFDLFDTDDTGCIEQRELQFAMSALGFQNRGHHHHHHHHNHNHQKHHHQIHHGMHKDTNIGDEDVALVVDTFMDDGKVTLEEFSALMTGELEGQDPYEEARTAFSILSRPDGNRKYDGLITLSKLEAVCAEYEV